MSAERPTCAIEKLPVIEKLSEQVGEPVFSIQGEVLTFNPHYFDNPEFRFHTQIDNGINSGDYKFEHQLKKFVRDTCAYCELCQPRFTYEKQSIFGIERKGYGFKNSAPGFEVTSYRPEGTPKAIVCIVDDEEANAISLAHRLKRTGVKAYAFSFYHNRRDASPFETTALVEEIISKHPDIVFCDLGLGSYSGIEVIQKIRELTDDKIKVGMLTGAFRTEEISNIAHRLFIRPVLYEDILNFIFQNINQNVNP